MSVSRTPVLCIWNDAHGAVQEADTVDFLDMGPCVTYTVGYLVIQNDQGVVLTDTIWEDPEMAEQVSSYNFIPCSMVVELLDLPIPDRVKALLSVPDPSQGEPH